MQILFFRTIQRSMVRIIVILFFLKVELSAQNVVNYEIPISGSIQLTEKISIGKINKGFTLWLPEGRTPKGLIVFTRSRRDTLESEFIIDYSLKKQFAVIFATTENRLEFFFETTKLNEIEDYLNQVITECDIPKKNLYYCGLSLEGTRALKLVIFSHSDLSRHKLIPKAIAICDSPLDMIRFHKSMVLAKELKFDPIAANEGE